MVEAELLNQGYTLIASGAGGYFAGWGMGKVIKLALKVIAGACGIFFAAIAYLQTQGYLNVNWDKIQLASDNAVQTLVSSDIVSGTNGGLYHTIASLGIPMSLGIGAGFMLGITKGLKG